MRMVRIPELRFETRTRPVTDPLPRMDIAAFVGFAASGPLHLPVPVEDTARFREIFGPDMPLAWNSAAGATEFSALGPCVESFFAQGGRRAWIVRVADPARIVTHRFGLLGVVAGGPGGLAGAALDMRARAPGSWCEDLALGTAIAREVLPIRRQPEPGAEAESRAVSLEPGGYRFDLIADPALLEPGDLLEVYFDEDLPRLWVFAAAITPAAGFLRVTSHALPVFGPTTGAFWVEAQADGTFASLPEPAALDALDAVGRRAAIATALLGAHAALLSVRRMRLSLHVWRGQDRMARLEGLGLCRDHSRFWARLPDDAALFASRSGLSGGRDAQPLDRQITSPRFPMAGPLDDLDGVARFTLPLGVARAACPETAAALPGVLEGSALERDGLDVFSATLFLDPTLMDLRNSVVTEAEHRYHMLGQGLRGLHALLPVEEVSLMALPDAIHPGWTRAPEPPAALLPAPDLHPIPDPEREGCIALSWTEVPEAERYRLDRAQDANFTENVQSHEAVSPELLLPVGSECPRRVFFRVRALRAGDASPWSNSQSRILPPAEFTNCAAIPPEALELARALAGSPPEERLVWAPRADARGVTATDFRVEIAGNAEFVGAEAHHTDAAELVLRAGAGEGRFARVQGRAGGVVGPWSNTVRIAATARRGWTLESELAFSDATLIHVHRAALRFAAGRGDMLCVLGLPRHYCAQEVALHLGRLGAGGATPLSEPAGSGAVPPFSTDEAHKLSYGALIHPWITIRTPDRGAARETITADIPPDGAVSGLLADVALAGGAWIAAANQPLKRALALAPTLSLDAWRALTPMGANILLRGPRGFTLQSQITLAPAGEIGAIHMRRLAILLRRLAVQVGARIVFANHDRRLRDYLRVRFQQALGALYARGAFDGATPEAAFTVTVDDTNNPPASVERGRLVVTLQVAPAQAITTITVRLITEESGRLAVEEI